MGREPTFPLAFRHTWSLAIEEQFYLFWPVMIWIVGRRGLPTLVLITISIAVVSRAWGMSHFILITRCDGLALGGLLAGLMSTQDRVHPVSPSNQARLTSLSLTAPGLVFMLLILVRLLNTRWPGWVPQSTIDSLKMLGANLVLVATVGGIVLHSGRPQLRWLRNPLLVYLGTISYGIYIYHHIIFKLSDNFSRPIHMARNLVVDLLKLGASIALAMLSWHIVERPILALKTWFRYQPPAHYCSIAVPSQVTDLGSVKVG